MPPDQPKRSKSAWHIANQQEGTDGLTVTTYASGRRRYDIVSSNRSFVDTAFNRFNLEEVCALLLHENPSFKGHKDALAAALCGWMMGPHWQPFRRRAVGLSIGRTLARAEQMAAKKSTDERIKGDRYPRIVRLPPAFFEELYYPIGGLDYITQIPARYGLRNEMTPLRDRLFHAITFAAIDHCHYRSVAANLALDAISIEKSCEVVVLIHLAADDFDAPDVNNLKNNYLAEFRESLPFLYAASTMQYSETQSLLSAIADAKWSSILRPGALRELFGRTLFYAQEVYAKQKKAKHRSLDVDKITHALGGVEPKQFDPPDRVNAHVKLIEYYYSKEGYDACHADDELMWNQAGFWAALDLPVPENKKRLRSGNSLEKVYTRQYLSPGRPAGI